LLIYNAGQNHWDLPCRRSLKRYQQQEFLRKTR
jgi:hypothetical protein